MPDEIVLRDPYEVLKIPDGKTTKEIIEETVRRILLNDGRLDSTPEVITTLRDYVKAEIACDIAFRNITEREEFNSNDERLFRGMLNMKNTLRDEIWGGVRGLKPKEEQMKKAHEIIIDAQSRILPAKKEIDPLDSN